MEIVLEEYRVIGGLLQFLRRVISKLFSEYRDIRGFSVFNFYYQELSESQ
jgi:hypothetical protein